MEPLAALKGIPEATAKEWVSLAYMQGICAQAGLNIGCSKWDDGVDMEIGSTKPVHPGIRYRNFKLIVQLKSTQNWRIKNGEVGYFLKGENYRQLRDPSTLPQYLVLYTMPCSRSRWIIREECCSCFLHAAFFLDMEGHPEIRPDATGKTVRVPVANRLTAASLRRLYIDRGLEWGRPDA